MTFKAYLVPHASVKKSTKLANTIYNNFANKTDLKIVILSTNHYTKENHVYKSSILDNIKIDDLNLDMDKEITHFNKEHSWKVQMSFLKKYDINKLTIILVGDNESFPIDDFLKKISNEHIIIGNTDLLHCGSNYNNECPNNIEKFNIETMNNMIQYFNNETNVLHNTRQKFKTMCGYPATKIFLDIIKKLNVVLYEQNHTSYIWYDNNNKNSVGYPILSFKKITLLDIPDKTLKLYFKNNNRNDVIEQIVNQYSYLDQKDNNYGIFVSIYYNNKLRGCIGTFNTTSKLVKLIAKKTLASAFDDNRFKSINKNELDNLTYEINFISTPITIYTNNNSSIEEIYNIVKQNIIIGIHGITIYYENNNATYLAQVLIDNFKIKDDTQFTLTKFEEIELSLRKKSRSKIDDNINKIEIYKCQNKSNKLFDLNLEGGMYYNYQLPLMLLGLARLSLIKI